MNNKEIAVEVKNLSVSFKTNQGMLKAVRDVSFNLYRGETLAVVGESGSGKSVTSRSIMGILAPNARVDGGQILFENQDLLKISEDDFHKIRGNKIGMIFQDPTSSLNPIMRVGKQITEAMILNGKHKVNKTKQLYSNEEIAVTNLNLKIEELKANEALNAEEKREQLDLTRAELKEAKSKLRIRKKEAKEIIKKEYKEIRLDHKRKVKEFNQSYFTKAKESRKLYISTNKEYKEKLAELKQHQKEEYNKVKKDPDLIGAIKVQVLKGLKYDQRDERKALKDEVFKVGSENEVFSAIGIYLNYFKQRYLLRDQYLRHIKVTKMEAREEAYKIMEEVGIAEPEKRFKMYPFQFSGGMKQRIVIAIALMAHPEVLICDEPTTALDVTIQAQILDLIKKIKKDRNLSVIFITHNLGVVANVADRVAVMYAGKIVESGSLDDVFYNPRHPYTWALMSSMPDINSKDKLQTISGTPPNMLYPPKGDAFAQRNPYALKIDFEEHPPLFKVSEGHYAATWLLHPDAPKVDIPQTIKDRIKYMKEEVARMKGEESHG